MTDLDRTDRNLGQTNRSNKSLSIKKLLKILSITFYGFSKNIFRSKQVLNEMEMLQRISTLETGPIHAFNPQLYQQQTLFQSQCLPPSAHSSVTAPSIQASVARLTHHQGVQPTFMVQATSQHQQQQAPRAPEPSYKGMSCENFHALVRRKLEDVAQAALNRTDGEREYQQKELILKNRLRLVIRPLYRPMTVENLLPRREYFTA